MYMIPSGEAPRKGNSVLKKKSHTLVYLSIHLPADTLSFSSLKQSATPGLEPAVSKS